MRPLILYIACSLDGKIARPDGGLDWLPPINPDQDYGYEAFYSGIDTIVMGYKTYEACLALGPWPYAGKTVYVFSRSPHPEPEAGIVFVSEDPVSFVSRLKQEAGGGSIWLEGGGQIIAPLHDAGLIDRYMLALVPVILGAGIPLFPDIHTSRTLKLCSQQTYPDGLVLLSLEPEPDR